MNNKEKVLELYNILDKRKKYYWISQLKPQPHQQVVLDCLKERNDDLTPVYKQILFQWWNWAWKTILWMYAAVAFALWEYATQYKMPYIWTKKNIRIVTKSWSNVSSTIEPYLLWDYSETRIPPEMISWAPKRSSNLLQSIKLTNWCLISIKTYDQGWERIQGWSPDLVIVDEEPTDKLVWQELLARTRNWKGQMLITMTPLSWLTPVYNHFYKHEVKAGDKIKKFLFSSLENKYADHSWANNLNEQDRKMRLNWEFVPPTGLVYQSFSRVDNLVEHFDPKDLPGVRFYWWLDLWITHPTWFALIAVDADGNHYVFDWFLEAWLYLSEIKQKIESLVAKYRIGLEYIVADSWAKRERVELAKIWLKTKPANKWNKGEKDESNRKASIFKINQLFWDWKLFISDRLSESLVVELEQHHYKSNGKDWEVVKEDDHILDALRYAIWAIKPHKAKTQKEKKFERKNSVTYNSKWYYSKNYRQPY